MTNAGYRVIDQEQWPRKAHCAVFRNSFRPQYCISFDLDVAYFYRRVKEKKWPFYLAMIYVVAAGFVGVLAGLVMNYTKYDPKLEAAIIGTSGYAAIDLLDYLPRILKEKISKHVRE